MSKCLLVHRTNEHAIIAVKTPTGISDRIEINNTIMQGSSIENKYRGKIVVPPLEMVGEVLTISKFGAKSTAMNQTVNSSMPGKKLQLNKLKCAKIHRKET